MDLDIDGNRRADRGRRLALDRRGERASERLAAISGRRVRSRRARRPTERRHRGATAARLGQRSISCESRTPQGCSSG